LTQKLQFLRRMKMCHRKKNHFQLVLLVWAVIALPFVFSSSGVAQAFNVNPTAISGDPSTTVTLEIEIDSAVTNMTDWGMDIYFDTDVLAFAGVDKVGTLSAPLSVGGSVKSFGARLGAYSTDNPPVTGDSGTLVKVLLNVKSNAYKNSAIQLKNFTDYLAGASTTDSTFEIKGVTITVDVSPASVNDVVAGDPVTLTAEVLVNGAHLDLTSVEDVTFSKTGNGAFGDKTLVGGNVQVDYTTDTTVEAATVTATENVTGGANQGSSMITSIPGPCAALTVSPDTATLTADQTQQFGATCVDANGNETSTGTLTWSGGAGIGTIGANGLFDATTVGTGTVTATSAIGPSDTSGTITVNPGVLATLTVSPDTATLTADDTQQFSVSGADADGNAAALGTITWSGGASIGTIGASTGLFDATTVGTDTVTAASDLGPSDSSGNIQVTPGAPAVIQLVSSREKVASGGKGTSDLTATVKDADGNTVTNLPPTAIEYTVTGAGVANAGWTTNEANTANGVATVVFTTEGEVPEPGSTTVNVVAQDKAGTFGLTSNAVTITIVNFSIDVVSPQAPFLDAQGVVNLVTSGSTPSTATFNGVGGESGDYRWALSSCGTLNSPTADSVTYTASATIDGSVCEDTLTLTSATDPSLEDSIAIKVYKPLSITWPPSVAGIALGDTTRTVTATGGTSAFAFQSSATGVATVDATGKITPVAVGTCTMQVRDVTFGVFGTANGFLAQTPQIEIINPIVIGNKPANDALQSKGTNQFTATGGKTEGQVDWEATAGTIDANGNFTAPEVTEGSTEVTITAYDKTYNKTSATPVKTEYVLTVYATLGIQPPPGFDPETPLTAGDEVAFNAVGGNGECVWTVAGPVDVPGGTNCAYTFVAPSTGDFGGVYDITVTDGKGFTTDYQVKVSIKITPEVLSFTETTEPEFMVTGASTDYTWEILEQPDDANPVATPEDYGTWANGDEVTDGNTNTFEPADVDEVMTFYVRVTVTGDPDLTEENGLNQIVGGPYRIIPVRSFVGRVVDELGDGILGAKVQVIAPADQAQSTQTNADGDFDFDLPDTGTIYRFWASKAGFLTADFTSDDLDDAEPENNQIELKAAAAGASITGTVTVAGLEPTVTIQVQAVNAPEGEAALAGNTTTEADGSFRFDFAADGAPYTLTASIPGFFGKTVVPALPAADVALDLTAVPGGAKCIEDPLAGGAVQGGGILAELPFGSVDTTAQADPFCFTMNMMAETWACGQGEGDVLYEIGADVTFAGEFLVTLPFDLAVVPPGAFESGDFAVYEADDLTTCTGVEVIPADRIWATDYIGDGMTGSVTVWVEHLSDFGIGAGAGSGTRLTDNSSDSRCFIATAAYGSPFEKHVQVLRQFRDVYLLPSKIGHAFVDAYYNLSPPAAEFIAGHDTLRALVRFALLPLVGMSYVMLHLGFLGSLMVLSSVLLVGWGICRIGRRPMRKAAFLAVPLVLACLLVAGSAQARQKTGYYGALYGLYAVENLDDDETKDKFSGPIDVDFDNSWGFQARVGYIYNEYFSLEGMYEYVAPFEANDGSLDDKLDVMNYTVNGKFTCPAYDAFVPYVIVGLGAMNAYEDIDFMGDNSKESDWGFGARVGLGFDYYFQREWSAGFEGTYVFGTGDVDHVRYMTLGLGVAYHF
jgi:hypothetical protein